MDDPNSLVTIVFPDDEAPQIAEDGALEIPLKTARKIAYWVRRYDLRPKSAKPNGHAK